MGEDDLPLAAAFAPNRRNNDGLSMFRRCFHTPKSVADFRTRAKSEAWVVSLRAQDLFDLGLSIQPDPIPAADGVAAQPGHAVIPEMNAAKRKTSDVEQWKERLRRAVTRVDGPFFPPEHTPE